MKVLGLLVPCPLPSFPSVRPILHVCEGVCMCYLHVCVRGGHVCMYYLHVCVLEEDMCVRVYVLSACMCV